MISRAVSLRSSRAIAPRLLDQEPLGGAIAPCDTFDTFDAFDARDISDTLDISNILCT